MFNSDESSHQLDKIWGWNALSLFYNTGVILKDKHDLHTKLHLHKEIIFILVILIVMSYTQPIFLSSFCDKEIIIETPGKT
jgi:hypothetical protein